MTESQPRSGMRGKDNETADAVRFDLWVHGSFFGAMLGLIFLSAGGWEFAQGWWYWFSFCGPTLFITLYFLKADPALIERRVRPVESRPRQAVGQSVAALLFAMLIAVPGLDRRFGWTSVSTTLSLASDALVAAGFAWVFLAFRENTFASRAIETMSHQKVIKTGVYTAVRHPMYSGAALIITATPPALGSWAGLAIAAPLIAVIVFRILDEEAMLKEELQGYRAYCQETKYRLIPHVW